MQEDEDRHVGRRRRLNQRLFAGYRSRALRLFEALSPDDRAALERIMERLIEELATLSDPAEESSVR